MQQDDIFYKISYVVEGGDFPGAIVNRDRKPQVGEELIFDGHVFEILEIMELTPPVGKFGFLHATCKFVREAS